MRDSLKLVKMSQILILNIGKSMSNLTLCKIIKGRIFKVYLEGIGDNYQRNKKHE